MCPFIVRLFFKKNSFFSFVSKRTRKKVGGGICQQFSVFHLVFKKNINISLFEPCQINVPPSQRKNIFFGFSEKSKTYSSVASRPPEVKKTKTKNCNIHICILAEFSKKLIFSFVSTCTRKKVRCTIYVTEKCCFLKK